jgi:SAM-dependent methyltransferase
MTQLDNLENRYYAYLRARSYSSEEALLAVLRVYLPYLNGFERVLDVGCGHGEFMQMLIQAGHRAVGVDLDSGMVQGCRVQGLEAHQADAIAWMQDHAGEFDAVFSSNVVEHLDAPTVAALVDSSFAALRPGGMILFTTPNPESAIVQFYEFWRDPTHVRPYNRQLMEFFLVDAGFERVQSAPNPMADWEGIDVMLEAVTTSLPQLPVIPPHASISPLPPPPGPGATLRQRLAWRVADFVYHKFTEPFVAPLRADLERRDETFAAISRSLALTNSCLTTLQERVRRLAAAARFLHPSREYLVLGYKPMVD